MHPRSVCLYTYAVRDNRTENKHTYAVCVCFLYDLYDCLCACIPSSLRAAGMFGYMTELETVDLTEEVTVEAEVLTHSLSVSLGICLSPFPISHLSISILFIPISFMRARI